MRFYKKIIGLIYLITLIFSVIKIFQGKSILSQPDIEYKIGGAVGLLIATSYSYWLLNSAFYEETYRKPGAVIIKSIAVLCSIVLLILLFYSFYMNLGQVELFYDLIAIAIMLAMYLPIVFYDTKLIINSLT
jgi:hypothetical protein